MTKKQLLFLIGVPALFAIAILILSYIAKDNVEGTWTTRDVKQFGREGPIAVTYQFHDGVLVVKRLFQDGEYSAKTNYKLNGNMLTIISPVDRMYDLKFKYEIKNGRLVMRCVSDTPEGKGVVLSFENRE